VFIFASQNSEITALIGILGDLIGIKPCQVTTPLDIEGIPLEVTVFNKTP
jgi:xanthosine utilization system XapX-like protein